MEQLHLTYRQTRTAELRRADERKREEWVWFMWNNVKHIPLAASSDARAFSRFRFVSPVLHSSLFRPVAFCFCAPQTINGINSRRIGRPSRESAHSFIISGSLKICIQQLRRESAGFGGPSCMTLTYTIRSVSHFYGLALSFYGLLGSLTYASMLDSAHRTS